MYYYVYVEDRQTHDVVIVGAMLTLSECRELIGVLRKYNATDLLIYKKYNASDLLIYKCEEKL